ncbi:MULTISPECIES: hypothetical protein [Staphylococcus]|uniref:Uncharacterized protein n=3 Tax=Staphylococcus TaxID=1279 RepID=A1IHM1_STAAU|nr:MULTISPECIES: hypothetical protein [Staphylococcus]MDU5816901.1 hypothetical protein [Staphylococcus sp.]HDK8962181.1 hypothetical protein [Staphylococcus aureus USA1000-94318]HDX8201580.1 hypothetical protein [Staphylococcus aureus W39830]HEH9897268.1 hypothetical protein [Staphylococcus aureus CI8]AWE63999.1 hypothetical protein CSC48_1333 [Staphylococcus aureus]
MASYLFFHPKPACDTYGDMNIYHDKFGNNEDPYVWSERFLHSFCKITDYAYSKSTQKDIIFWISINKEGNNLKYLCDLVFKIEKWDFWYKTFSEQKDAIATNKELTINDAVVEGDEEAYEYHYSWINRGEHKWEPTYRRRRLTLKADPVLSFQPQNRQGNLLDVTELLKTIVNFNVEKSPAKSGTSYKAFELEEEQASKLYEEIKRLSFIRLKGRDLKNLRRNFS